jgi:hypothetical protein
MPAETFEPATQKCCSWTSLFTRGDFGAAQGLTTPVPINARSIPMTDTKDHFSTDVEAANERNKQFNDFVSSTTC